MTPTLPSRFGHVWWCGFALNIICYILEKEWTKSDVTPGWTFHFEVQTHFLWVGYVLLVSLNRCGGRNRNNCLSVPIPELISYQCISTSLAWLFGTRPLQFVIWFPTQSYSIQQEASLFGKEASLERAFVSTCIIIAVCWKSGSYTASVVQT